MNSPDNPRKKQDYTNYKSKIRKFFHQYVKNLIEVGPVFQEENGITVTVSSSKIFHVVTGKYFSINGK